MQNAHTDCPPKTCWYFVVGLPTTTVVVVLIVVACAFRRVAKPCKINSWAEFESASWSSIACLGHISKPTSTSQLTTLTFTLSLLPFYRQLVPVAVSLSLFLPLKILFAPRVACQSPWPENNILFFLPFFCSFSFVCRCLSSSFVYFKIEF